MAAKSFLTRSALELAASELLAPPSPPNGDEGAIEQLQSLEFSKWLGADLLRRLSGFPDWLEAGPVILGSWARGELSPKSDIDLLFCGSEDAVKRFLESVGSSTQNEPLKLRYRMPENLSDWTVGVLPFDILALLTAVPVTSYSKTQLERQLDKIRARGRGFKKELLSAMIAERKARSERYDSIANFLEPNIKFGPGGLRDLEQALVTLTLFSEKFTLLQAEVRHAEKVLFYYKRFFLLVRQKLHLAPGGGDVLSANEQFAISEWLGYKSNKDFMREIQKGIARVSFYADWLIEQAWMPQAKLRQVEARRLKTTRDLFLALQEDPSTLMQSRVRVAGDQIFSHYHSRMDSAIGARLSEMIQPKTPEAPLVALFRSRLIDHCVPELRRVVGHVQHDQYHRFSVDAHILQALRETKRLFKNPKLAGRLKDVVKALTSVEWQILSFACLYHDIAKGREGHHAELGEKIAKLDLKRFGKSSSFIREVCWLVEQHLILSGAAFRENPKSPRTWRKLTENGAVGRRLKLLTVFTIVDIRATNPDAWTSWKERLLFELVQQMEKPEANTLLKFAQVFKLELAKSRRFATDCERIAEKFTETLDPYLLAALAPRTLSQDLTKTLMQATNRSPPEPPLVVRVRGGKQTWVRFHSAQDRKGLFLEYVSLLARSGLSVRHASILTDDALGVYDWFEVKSSKSPAHIRKLLGAKTGPVSESTKAKQVVRFDSIEEVGSDDREWVISFRGRDQAGALNEAARALFAEGTEILWAKVHTWGRQIDDVFGVRKPASVSESAALIGRLRARLVT